MNKQRINELREFTNSINADARVEVADDRMYVEVEINHGDIDIDILFTNVKDEYYATGIESSGLPRNIYNDNFRDDMVDQRNAEILATVKDLLLKRIDFHKSKSIFNRKKGYIVLAIDGVKTKFPLKGNYFGLNVSDS